MANLYRCLVELTASAETDLTGPGTFDSIAGTYALGSRTHTAVFTLEASGCAVTYNGTEPADVMADCAVSVNATATGEIALGWHVDGVQVQEHVHTQPGNTNITPASLPVWLYVEPGQVIELRMENHANDTNATAEHVVMRLAAFARTSS